MEPILQVKNSSNLKTAAAECVEMQILLSEQEGEKKKKPKQTNEVGSIIYPLLHILDFSKQQFILAE